MMTLWQLLQKDYIPSAEHWKEMWVNASKRDSEWDWIPIDKVRIKKIKIDKELFSFQNEVDEQQVSHMIHSFDKEVWQPIHINQDYFLLDGQHRLRLAFRTGMKYIDVIMEKKKNPGIIGSATIKRGAHRFCPKMKPALSKAKAILLTSLS